MNNPFVTNLVYTSNDSDTSSVTSKIANTNCIVCGKVFAMPRMSKLYCSSRCKQFGYNHKLEIIQALAVKERGINPTQMTFYIDDYNSYSKKNRMLRRFKELEKKKSEWEITNQEMVQRQKLDLTINNLSF